MTEGFLIGVEDHRVAFLLFKFGHCVIENLRI